MKVASAKARTATVALARLKTADARRDRLRTGASRTGAATAIIALRDGYWPHGEIAGRVGPPGRAGCPTQSAAADPNSRPWLPRTEGGTRIRRVVRWEMRVHHAGRAPSVRRRERRRPALV